MEQEAVRSKDKQKPPEPKPLYQELSGEETTASIHPFISISGPPDDITQRQAQILKNRRLDRSQRQKWATGIGRLEGNHFLQRLLETTPDPLERSPQNRSEAGQQGAGLLTDRGPAALIHPASEPPCDGVGTIQRRPDHPGVRHRPQGVYYHTDRIDVVVTAREGDDIESLKSRATTMLTSRLARPDSPETPEEIMARIFPGGTITTDIEGMQIRPDRNYVCQYFTGHLETAERVRLGLAIATARIVEEMLPDVSAILGNEPGGEPGEAAPEVTRTPPEGTPEQEGTPYGEEEGGAGDPMFAFLERFEEAATLITQEILDRAEQAVLQERERYTGIPAQRPEEPEVEIGEGGEEVAAAPVEATRRGHATRHLVGATVGAESRAQGERENLAERVRTIQLGEEPSQRTRRGRGFREMEARRAAQEEYPILAALPPDEFAEIATAGPRQQEILEAHISERLAAIRQVREGLGGEFSIWENVRIIRTTKEQMGIAPNSPEDLWVEHHRQMVQVNESVRDFFLGVISFAFAMLASAATGGAAAVFAGAALATGLAEVGREWEEYQTERAATLTHFDRREALSQCEPSVMWLALAVVGVFIDATEFGVMVARLAAPINDALRLAESSGQALEASRRTELLTEFETAVRREHAPLSQAGRVDPGSEERLVAQAVEAARAHLDEAGEGVRRGAARTATYEEMSTIFQRATGSGGPRRAQFRVFDTRTEYELEWQAVCIRADITGPVPNGFYYRGTIHLPPDASIETVVHETLHWSSEQSGFRRRMGAFLEEGVTESLAQRIAGPMPYPVYEENIAFAEALGRAVSQRAIDDAFLRNDWSLLEGALHAGLGTEARADEFMGLIRRVGDNGEPAVALRRAREMLGSFAERPALPLTPVQ